MDSKYDDIINLPHHTSRKHPRMPVGNRAAQFMPFAALTGYDDAVRETARLTDARMELDEDAKKELDRKIQLLQKHLPEHPQVTVTYFVPDAKKAGGAYADVTGNVKKIDYNRKILVLTDGKMIPMEEITEVDGELFAL